MASHLITRPPIHRSRCCCLAFSSTTRRASQIAASAPLKRAQGGGYVVNAAVLPLLGVLHGFEQHIAVGVIVADPRPTVRTPRRAPPASPEFQRLS